MFQPVKHSILFDMDGVLVDSEPVIEAAAIAGLAEFGVNAKPEDFRPFLGAGEDRYVGGVAEKYGMPYRLEMKTRVYEIYLEIVPFKLKVFDGIGRLLDDLKEYGFRMALASSADRIKVQANLKVANISESIFTTVISGEDVVFKKPSPEIYLKAAGRIEADPAFCVVVEDAVNGIRAAKAAGMKCIAITSSFSREVLGRENPDFICNKTTDIYPVLVKLG